jgi:hypothetical protein
VPRALRFAGFGWLLALGACRSMVGIEEAEVDPALGQAEVDPAPLGDGGSAGTGGGSTTAGGSGGTVNLEPVLSTCERYCNTVTQTCSGQFAQYATQTDCLAVCLLLPEGQVGETEHNSVQCRLTAAGQAPLESPGPAATVFAAPTARACARWSKACAPPRPTPKSSPAARRTARS